MLFGCRPCERPGYYLWHGVAEESIQAPYSVRNSFLSYRTRFNYNASKNLRRIIIKYNRVVKLRIDVISALLAKANLFPILIYGARNPPVNRSRSTYVGDVCQLHIRNISAWPPGDAQRRKGKAKRHQSSNLITGIHVHKPNESDEHVTTAGPNTFRRLDTGLDHERISSLVSPFGPSR